MTTSYCAGVLGTTGMADGPADSATFDSLWSLSRGYAQSDGSFALLVGSDSPSLRVVTQQCAQVATLVGDSASPGFVNGAASAARFGSLITAAAYLAVGSSQQVFVTSALDHSVRVVQMLGAVPQTVGWIAGGSSSLVFGSTDGAWEGRFPACRLLFPIFTACQNPEYPEAVFCVLDMLTTHRRWHQCAIQPADRGYCRHDRRGASALHCRQAEPCRAPTRV